MRKLNQAIIGQNLGDSTPNKLRAVYYAKKEQLAEGEAEVKEVKIQYEAEKTVTEDEKKKLEAL